MRRALPVIVPLVALALVTSATATSALSHPATKKASASVPSIPQNVWGVEVGPKVMRLLDRKTLRKLRDAGVNTIFGRADRLNRAQRKELVKISKDWGFKLLWPKQAKNGHGAAVVLTTGSSRAASLAASTNADVIVVRVQSPAGVAGLAKVASKGHRVVALANVSAQPRFAVQSWIGAIRAAASSGSLDLAVSPSGLTRKQGLGLYADLLKVMGPTVKQLASAAHTTAVDAASVSATSGAAARGPKPTKPGKTTTTTVTLQTHPTTTTQTNQTTTSVTIQTHPTTTTATTTPTTTTVKTTTSTTTTATTTTPTQTQPTTTTSTTTTAPPTVDGNAYVSPSGSDSNACTAAAPCASFSKAYRTVKPGQTIWVASGSYPAQRIDFDSTKTSSVVTVAPAAGASVSVAQLDMGQGQIPVRGPAHVVVRDMTIGYTAVWEGSDDVVLQNLKGRGFDIVSAGSGIALPNNVRVVGGDYGPCEAVAQNGNCTSRMIGTNIVVDGATIHDVTSNNPSLYHTDGIFMRGCSGCAVRNTTFRTNDVTNIRIQNCCGLTPNQNITLANNSFGQPNGGRSDGVDVDTAVQGLVFENNTFDPLSGPVILAGTATFTGNKMMYANGPCVAGATYIGNTVKPFSQYYNVLCGTTDKWGSWVL